MLAFSWYMLKVIICSGILFAYYWLFLRNKIFHHYNRFYLLASIALSLLLPLLKINYWQPSPNTNQAVRVLQVVSVGDDYVNTVVTTANKSNWSLEQLYTLAYWLISIIFCVITVRTLLLICKLLKKYPIQKIENVAFINTQHRSTPFSFLRYIFWNSDIDINTITGRQIFKHEVAHIQQKHTYDKLFLNTLLIVCWCNPFFWLYRKELNMIHEFIADKKAVEDSDTAAFAAMILQAAYPKHRFELTNNFFYSPIKRRLMMLTKNKNPWVNYIWRIMVLPLLALIFAAFTFKTKETATIYHGKKITVVIDAGHGGYDFGAGSANGIYEKDIVLAISKKIKELNSNNAIEIILTRDEDVYISPQQKISFAKNKNADLFISFHLDNGPKESANKHSGISLWVANDEFSNAAKSKVLASAIIKEFNNNYALPVMFSLNQGKNNVYILQANTCPSVLIEAGFINNDKDLSYLQTGAAKEVIAKNVLMAIEKFANSNNSISIQSQQSIINIPVSSSLKDTNPAKIITSVNTKAGPPLYIVNGKETDQKTALTVKPDDIQEITVLKDKNAIQLYGENGKNGVIIIKLKSNLIPKTVEIYDSTGKSMGTIIITERKDDIEKRSDELKNNSEQPHIYLGKISGGRINLDYLKSQTEIGVSRGYSFIGAGVYVSGPSFKKAVIFYQINSSASLNDMQEKIVNNCHNGDVLVFDNVWVKDNNGNKIMISAPPAFQIYEEPKVVPEDSKSLVSDDKVFTVTETPPQFTGGKEAWLKFLRANLKTGTPVDNGAKAGIYKVELKFIVNTDGSLSDITCEKDPGFGTCAEAIRFIKTTPKWQAAIQNGKKVNAYLKQPITFFVEDANDIQYGMEIYKVPLKVHMMNENEISTYNLVGNGEFAIKSGMLYYLNGKIINDPGSIAKLSIASMESYDERSGRKYFGEKGKNGVLLLKTKS